VDRPCDFISSQFTYRGKVVRVLNCVLRHEDVWRCGRIVPGILNFGARWRRVVSFTPLPLYLRGKSLRYHWWEAGWALEPVWTRWQREKTHSSVRSRTSV